MPTDLYQYTTVPIGSLVLHDLAEADRYMNFLSALTPGLVNIVMSDTVGAFLRGLAKEFGLPNENVPQLAFAVLRVAVGEIELPKLGATLSSELKLPNDKAQAMAKEIEKELFSPVMLELNQWLEKQKQATSTKASAAKAGARNIVDLKHQSPKQPPGPLPKPGQFNR